MFHISHNHIEMRVLSGMVSFELITLASLPAGTTLPAAISPSQTTAAAPPTFLGLPVLDGYFLLFVGMIAAAVLTAYVVTLLGKGKFSQQMGGVFPSLGARGFFASMLTLLLVSILLFQFAEITSNYCPDWTVIVTTQMVHSILLFAELFWSVSLIAVVGSYLSRQWKPTFAYSMILLSPFTLSAGEVITFQLFESCGSWEITPGWGWVIDLTAFLAMIGAIVAASMGIRMQSLLVTR